MIRTPKFPKMRSPHDFGYLVGLTDRAYARFGLCCCLDAARGKYTYGDAEELMIEFNAARRLASGSSAPPLAPHKVQRSKLDRILLAGTQFRMNAVRMLLKTSNLHLNDLSGRPYVTNDRTPGNLRYNGEFNALVEVARASVRMGRVINSNEIAELLVY
jgi:hypothetical protein